MMSDDKPLPDPETLAYQVHDLAECILVANDKLELALLDINKTLRAINSALLSIAAAIAKGPC
jgi:hypothetical protein